MNTALRILTALALLLAAAVPAVALDHGPYSMEIIVDGRPLEELAARGRTYIEALEGREYSVRLTNRTGRRIAVALAVDGLNSIDARTTSAREARKWIIGPHGSITLDGWQTGLDTARRFFFTTEENSYGSWLGKTNNLGVITAVVFREKRREPVAFQEPRSAGEKRKAAGADAEPGRRPEQEGAAAEADDMAATGIGREVDHRVRKVRFDAERTSAAVLELRYEYHDALVRLGVLTHRFACGEDPLDRRERARGFDDLDFAPDPYR